MFKNLNEKGFTLIELLVSVSIILMLSSVFLVNYRGGDTMARLTMSAQKLASDIRMAQNNTLGSVEYNTVIPPGGWGVHFDRVSNDKGYLLFADLDEDMEYDTGTGEEADTQYGGRIVELPIGISIKSILVNAVPVNVIDISFLPPDPITNILNGSATSTKVTIVLEENENNAEKEIKVNYFGLIEVIE